MSSTDSVFYDFVEVGTSDFDTLMQSAPDTDRGISIEPIPFYLERLPDRPNCFKLNAAVSGTDGECQIYYIDPDLIGRMNLPEWLRGCNSIGAIHPTAAQILINHGLEPMAVVTSKKIHMLRLSSVLEKFRAAGVYFLKIDTEGHDLIILGEFFRSARRELWPYHLKFESNILSNSDELQFFVAYIIKKGYDLVSFGDDAVLNLNLRRARSGGYFSREIDGYYLAGYPEGCDPKNNVLPYCNTLEAAQAYCVEHECCGVTLQNGQYEVRGGEYLLKNPPQVSSCSWVRL